MSRKLDYRVKQTGHRNGLPYFDLIIPGRKATRLSATDKAAAAAEGATLYAKLANEPAVKVTATAHTLRDAVTTYQASHAYARYKPLTLRDRRSHFGIILAMPASSGKHQLGESLLSDWLHDVGAPDAVRRVMAGCGTKAAQANHLRKALNEFFKWLLGPEPQAGEARVRFRVHGHARNPVTDVAKALPVRERDENGRIKRGHRSFTDVQIEDWLHAAKDDPLEYFCVRLLRITGARTSDLHRLNRGMIKQTPEGRVLTYTCAKGDESEFRDASVACVPMVPELEALIAELPKDQFMFVVGEHGRGFACAESMGNKIRKWRRAAGLPEGLSAHGMRKSATYWWLDNHADLIPNNFALKAIFGWATDKELERYTRDYNRERAARGMLVRLADRRKAAGG